MTRHSDTIESLRERGVRLTPQRMLILNIVAHSDDHLGVDEVYGRAKESYPYIDVATVYRTLHLLKKLGVVTEVAIGDRLHFELTDPHRKHHHMVCRACGGAYNLDPAYLKAFRQTLVKEFAFEPDLDNFTVTGVCAKCAKKTGRK
ncbi:MAG: transcriptional repressor [SAR202 cluster bacterium]|nr:transcriptional repressor [SAR202 cluster bacterium]